MDGNLNLIILMYCATVHGKVKQQCYRLPFFFLIWVSLLSFTGLWKTFIIRNRTYSWIQYLDTFFLSCSFHQVRHSKIVFLHLRTMSAQTSLSLCELKSYNHATKEENMIHVVFRYRQRCRMRDKGLFCFFPSLQFCQTRLLSHRVMKSDLMQYDRYFENHY